MKPSNNNDHLRKTASEWIITRADPLVSTSQRAQLDHDFAQECSENSVWAQAWFAGLIADAVCTLPVSDPWRRLSGRVGDSDESMLAEGDYGMPENTGACGPNGRFGTWRDSNDLRIPSMGDITTDIGLAALAEPLPQTSAALIAFARLGWGRLSTAIEYLTSSEQRTVYDVCEPALRWAFHRREIYTGTDDQFLVYSAFSWLYRADMAAIGTPWDTSEVESQIRENAIDDGTYAVLRLDQ